MNFNNSRFVDHKPMKFGTFVPYMYRFVVIVKYLTNFFKLEWNLGIKFTLRFFFLSVYIYIGKLLNHRMRITEGSECSDLRFLDPWFCVVLTPGFMWKQAGLGGSLGCTSNWWSGGRGFDSRLVRQHYVIKIEHETFLRPFSQFRWF